MVRPDRSKHVSHMDATDRVVVKEVDVVVDAVDRQVLGQPQHGPQVHGAAHGDEIHLAALQGRQNRAPEILDLILAVANVRQAAQPGVLLEHLGEAALGKLGRVGGSNGALLAENGGCAELEAAVRQRRSVLHAAIEGWKAHGRHLV